MCTMLHVTFVLGVAIALMSFSGTRGCFEGFEIKNKCFHAFKAGSELERTNIKVFSLNPNCQLHILEPRELRVNLNFERK